MSDFRRCALRYGQEKGIQAASAAIEACKGSAIIRETGPGMKEHL